MFEGKENKITEEHLKNGETCAVTGYGNSMVPILKSGETVIVEPVTDSTLLEKGNIVFCKVKGHYYLHKISAVKGKTYQISNNHGHINGTVSRNCIFGIMRSKA